MEEPISIWTRLRGLLLIALVVALFFLPRDLSQVVDALPGGQRSAVVSTVEEVPADTSEAAPSAVASAPEDIRFTTANSLNMRAAPSTNGAVIAGLPRGTRVSVTDTEGSWLFVRTPDGEGGWISSKWATSTPP